MEHHIAQSSPISPRQKGMEGSRQALLYGVYDAFAGARSLISRRLCALITAIGIAVLTISSSAWASHDDTAVNEVDTATPALASPTAGDNQPGTGTIGDRSVHNEHLAEVNDLDGAPDTNPGTEGAVGPLNINNEAVTSRTLKKVIPEGDTGEGTEGAVNNDNINNDAVTSRTIEDGAVGEADLANGAVSGGPGGVIEDESITVEDIADNAVRSEEIGTGQVCGSENNVGCADDGAGVRSHIRPGSIGQEDLAADAVNTVEIVNGAVTNPKLAPNAVSGSGGAGTNNIEANSITDDEIADDAVGRGELADNAVEEENIGAGEVCGSIDAGPNCGAGTNKHIGEGTIGELDLANQAVTTSKLKQVESTGGPNDGTNGAVNTNNINNEAVTTRTIDDEAVTTGKIDDQAVTTGKLKQVNPLGATAEEQAGAVSENNINNEAVSERTIRTQAVSERTIRDQAVTSAKLKQINPDGATEEERQGAIFNEHINDDAVSARTIQNDAVQGRHIADGAIEVVGSAGAPRNTNAFQARIVPGSIGLGDFGDDVNNVFRRIEGDIDRLDEGIAMSHAISMIKVPEGKEFGISFAGGFYQDKQAAAIGVGFRPTDGLLLSAGASYGFDSEEVGGAVSINFGF